MQYLRVYADDEGQTHLEDVTVDAELREVVAGVPPVLVGAPQPASALIFVEQPEDATDWQLHVAPQRQWVILLRGRAAIEVSDGARRELGPGAVLLAEDTEGVGHLSTPLTDDLQFVMIPTGS